MHLIVICFYFVDRQVTISNSVGEGIVMMDYVMIGNIFLVRNFLGNLFCFVCIFNLDCECLNTGQISINEDEIHGLLPGAEEESITPYKVAEYSLCIVFQDTVLMTFVVPLISISRRQYH